VTLKNIAVHPSGSAEESLRGTSGASTSSSASISVASASAVAASSAMRSFVDFAHRRKNWGCSFYSFLSILLSSTFQKGMLGFLFSYAMATNV
jgi:hypothetical protein